MSDTKYTYAVARIRALEVSLFSSSTIEQLIACKDHESCLRFLTEHGWGGVDVPLNADAILTREQEKIWETIREMQVDMDVFDVLSYPNWFHNLKAAVKEVCTGKSGANIYFEGTPISKEEMTRIIREKDYQALPENMREAASEAVDTLLHSGDGQLCDVIIDRATMEAILAAGKKSKAAIIRDYAESTVAVANIKVAVRCCKTGKSLEFMKRAMAPCKTLNVERLAHAALVGLDAVMEYLNGAGYAEAAEALKESPSAFERWCDNRIIETIQPQKTNPFSVGLCDVIIDRTTMEAILAAGKKSKAAIIRDYAESTVAVANIKVAVRCCKTGKSLEFMKRAMAPCKTLNVERLAHAALVGLDAVMEYLNGAGYAEAAEALKESPSAFERWCDNRIIETIQPQKTNPFSVGPLVAYVIARQNEIKTVRIILTCKQNGLSDDSIRERVREMYV